MEIQVLGGACALDCQGGPRWLERKTAALLAYLALEGPTARGRLVGLLWPESPEATARNNLRQLLRRLRSLLGQDCIDGGDPLCLREGLVLDVLKLRAAWAAGEHSVESSFSGELLEGCVYDDCDELREWLDGWRERLRQERQEALEREVLRLEGQGLLPAALEGARRLLVLAPTSEGAYRHVMRLVHLLGDRAAALETYRQCREMLKREFGVEPSAPTRELARAIESHEAARRIPAPAPGSALLLSVVHPPVLAGREREWALMEEAWRDRKPILVDGEAGIGKSRLMMDFARSRKRWVLLNARPGDRHLPYATHTRSLRAVLALDPAVTMKPWIRKQLSRLAPELHPHPLPLPRTPEEKTRLFAAAGEFLREALQGVDVLIFDDAQYMDRESSELGVHLHAELSEEMAAQRFPLIINGHRSVEWMDPWEQELILQAFDAGIVVRVPVKPLDVAEVRKMLRGMGSAALEQVAEEMTAYTGGNPLFIVETARHLLQSGTFEGNFPASLPPPGRVRAIIEQRIRLLPPDARRLAYVFAVARTDFNVEMASEVLGLPLDLLAVPWRQLEEAEIIRGQWFVHDLLGEVLLATVPEPVRNSLELRISSWRWRSR